MRKRTLTVYPNPYAHIDANGRLAGATPVGELPRLTSVMPTRTFVGAERKLLDHDTKDRGPGMTQFSRAEYRFMWGTEPVTVDAQGQLETYYRQRAAQGDVFLLPSGTKEPPLAKLAGARAAAVARFRAEQAHDPACPVVAESAKTCACVSDPDTTEWAEQFPLDLEVEAAAEILAEKAAAQAAAADAAQKAASKTPKPAATPDPKEVRRKARAEAMARARERLGAKPPPPTEPSTTTEDGAAAATGRKPGKES